MFTEQYKDQVYFADTFAVDYDEVYNQLVAILNENNVTHGLLKGTEDYWCRDYMPVQCGYQDFIQFYYHPDYLKNDRKHETLPDTIERITLDTIGCSAQMVKITADGGNFTVCESKHGHNILVMTEKIFHENSFLNKDDIIREIENRFHTEILFLPWDTKDKCGHTDGIIHNIGNGRVLVNLELYPSVIANEMRKRLEEKFVVIDLKLSDYHKDSWAYINMLQTRDIIIIPALGIDTDTEALAQIKELHSAYDGRIYQVNVAKIVEKWNGALNCLSWTINTDDSKIQHSKELDEISII